MVVLLEKHGTQSSSAEKLLLIVEGPSDSGFVETLCKKLEQSCKVLTMRGNNLDKAKRMLKSMEFSKAIILKNSHNHSIEFLNKIKKSIEHFHPNVYVVIVRKCIESWIVSGIECRNAEDSPNPVEDLRYILARKGIEHLKSPHLYRGLGEEIKLECTKKAESFVEFLKRLEDL